MNVPAPPPLHVARLDTPLGPLRLAGTALGLSRIWLPGEREANEPGLPEIPDPGPLAEAIRQLLDYFAGTLRRFSLPLAPGGTPFQRLVWDALLEIPYGETVTYGALARRLGRPGAARAVGAANGANPLPVVVPCHRVVGPGGRLVGYGGGLAVKAALLALERDVASGQPPLLSVPIAPGGRAAPGRPGGSTAGSRSSGRRGGQAPGRSAP